MVWSARWQQNVEPASPLLKNEACLVTPSKPIKASTRDPASGHLFQLGRLPVTGFRFPEHELSVGKQQDPRTRRSPLQRDVPEARMVKIKALLDAPPTTPINWGAVEAPTGGLSTSTLRWLAAQPVWEVAPLAAHEQRPQTGASESHLIEAQNSREPFSGVVERLREGTRLRVLATSTLPNGSHRACIVRDGEANPIGWIDQTDIRRSWPRPMYEALIPLKVRFLGLCPPARFHLLLGASLHCCIAALLHRCCSWIASDCS